MRKKIDHVFYGWLSSILLITIGVAVSFLLEKGLPIWKVFIAVTLVNFVYSAFCIQVFDDEKLKNWTDVLCCFVCSLAMIIDALIMWGAYSLMGVYGPIVYAIIFSAAKIIMIRVEIKSLYEEIHKEEDHESNSMDDQAQDVSDKTDRPDSDGDESEQTD